MQQLISYGNYCLLLLSLLPSSVTLWYSSYCRLRRAHAREKKGLVQRLRSLLLLRHLSFTILLSERVAVPLPVLSMLKWIMKFK